jgi:hypothetical protein
LLVFLTRSNPRTFPARAARMSTTGETPGEAPAAAAAPRGVWKGRSRSAARHCSFEDVRAALNAPSVLKTIEDKDPWEVVKHVIMERLEAGETPAAEPPSPDATYAELAANARRALVAGQAWAQKELRDMTVTAVGELLREAQRESKAVGRTHVTADIRLPTVLSPVECVESVTTHAVSLLPKEMQSVLTPDGAGDGLIVAARGAFGLTLLLSWKGATRMHGPLDGSEDADVSDNATEASSLLKRRVTQATAATLHVLEDEGLVPKRARLS